MMGPFEFIILFLSFIYTLALTHLLFAATRMIRHRRDLVLSWPHSLWMLAALSNLVANWISQWDFRDMESLSLGTIAAALVFAITNYFVCALVSPDFESGETYNMREFPEQEGRTYIGAVLVLVICALVENFAAGAALGVQNWGEQNWVVAFMIVPPVLALTVKRTWAQVAAPIIFVATAIAYCVIYYPVLAR
jgi:hypothetical protein